MWFSLSFAALASLPTFATLPAHMQADSDSTQKAPAAQTAPKQSAKELGQIHWDLRLEPALKASAADSKPIMLLFQEVPG